MELLIGAGVVGALALFFSQSKALPSASDFKAAQDKLAASPEDPDANTIAGKYISFVQGNYGDGLKYLSKSGDKTLRLLAEHERAPLYTDTAPQKVGMGDEWMSSARSFPALSRIFYDRASKWYSEAYPDLDPLWKMKAREQAAKLAASRPPGAARKGLPSGWKTDMGSPVLDGTVAHIGSYSVKMPADPKGEVFLKSDPIQLAGSQLLEYSGWVRSDGTESSNDQLFLNYFGKDGNFMGVSTVSAPIDLPFWSYVAGTAKPPAGAVFVRVGMSVRSHKGTLWVDDLSLKFDGKEVLKNPSFESP